MPTDLRTRKLARLIVNYSVAVKKGENVVTCVTAFLENQYFPPNPASRPIAHSSFLIAHSLKPIPATYSTSARLSP